MPCFCLVFHDQACVPVHITLYFLTRTIVTLFLEFFTVPFCNSLLPLKLSHCFIETFLYTLTFKFVCTLYTMHVVELRFVNKTNTHTHTHTHTQFMTHTSFYNILRTEL